MRCIVMFQSETNTYFTGFRLMKEAGNAEQYQHKTTPASARFQVGLV